MQNSLTISRHVVSGELLEVGGLKPFVVSIHRPHHAGPWLFENLVGGKSQKVKCGNCILNPFKNSKQYSPGILHSDLPAPLRTHLGQPPQLRRRGMSVVSRDRPLLTVYLSKCSNFHYMQWIWIQKHTAIKSKKTCNDCEHPPLG